MYGSHVTKHLCNGTLAVIFVTLLFTSCSNRVPSELSWTEEVRLSDGRTIVVARAVGLRDDTTVGGPGEIATTRSQVRALEPPGLFPAWSAPLMVQLLDVSLASGEMVLIAHAYTCESWIAIGRPPYSTRVMYVARGGRWEMQPLSQEFIGRKANMLMRVRQSRAFENRPVPASEKNALNGGAATEYMTMNPTPGAAASCSTH
jgi:hypothetical protein